DVVVGDGIAVGGNEEPGAHARNDLVRAARLLKAARAVLAELAKVLLERALHERLQVLAAGVGRILIRAPVDLDAHRAHRPLHLRDAARKTRGALVRGGRSLRRPRRQGGRIPAVPGARALRGPPRLNRAAIAAAVTESRDWDH